MWLPRPCLDEDEVQADVHAHPSQENRPINNFLPASKNQHTKQAALRTRLPPRPVPRSPNSSTVPLVSLSPTPPSHTLKTHIQTWDTLSFVSKVDVISVPYGENTSPGTMEVMARVDLSESTETVWKVSRLVSKMLTGNHCADGVGRQAAERTACCASSQSEYSVSKPLRGNYSSDRLKFTVLR